MAKLTSLRRKALPAALLVIALGCKDSTVPTEPIAVQPQIVLNRASDDGYGIYRMKRDGSEIVRITPTWGDDLAVSPTAEMVAFSLYEQVGSNEVYVVGIDGSGERNVTNSSAYEATPAWSPDGTKLAFTSNRTGDFEIFVMNLDGSELVNLTKDTEADDWEPAWSPDGSVILFRKQGTTTGLYVMNDDGSEPRLLRSDAVFGGADWSPDGRRITGAAVPDDNGNYGIVVMDSNGSNALSLTPQSSSTGDMFPKWSPYTREIAFVRSGSIILIGTDGQNEVELSGLGGTHTSVAWLP